MGDSNIWGPLIWSSLLSFGDTTSALADRPSRRAHLEDFCTLVVALERVLPCRRCRDSFCAMNRVVPVTMCLTESVHPVYWTFFVHNGVNVKLEKPFYPMISVVRGLNIARFGSAQCARMVFFVSLWADVYCRTVPTVRALDAWFGCVLRLAQRDPYLARFSASFADWSARAPGAFVQSAPRVRERLARVLNRYTDVPVTADEYAKRFRIMLPETTCPLHATREGSGGVDRA